MPVKSIIVLFSTINLMSATTLWFIGFQGIRQISSSGRCGEVCFYVRVAFGANSFSDEFLLVITLLLAVIHLIGGLAATQASECGLTVFASAYIIRFLILVIDSTVKAAVGPHNWKDLLLMVDHKQSKVANDFRLCVTIVQLFLVIWSLALIARFRALNNRRIKRQSLNMVLQSWLLENRRKTIS